MGIFDIIEDLTKTIVETAVRLPEIPIRVVKGTIEGVEKGLEKIGDSLD